MNEDVKSENLRIHSRADELIACLEGEIAKRDARILGLESQYQRDVYGLNNEGDPIGGDPAGGYANDNARLHAELAAIKAQDTVGEVVGWYRLDRPYEMTHYPSVCATWHKLGAPVAPLYAVPVRQVSVPDGPAKMQWPEIVALVNEVLGCEAHKYPCERGSIGHEMTGINFNSLARIIDRVRYAAPAAPAADAGLVEALRKIMEAHRFNMSGMSVTEVHSICFYALAANRAKGVL